MHSLDAFRGFDIAAMLLVNLTWNEQVFHRQLFHVDWNASAQGATFTDLVFPWFLFIAGAAIPLSMDSGRGQSQTGSEKIRTAFRRSVVLYFLGVLLTVAGSYFDRPAQWTDVFRWNVLQLIAWGYFTAVCVFLLPRRAQFGFVVVVLLGKWLLLAGLPYDVVSEPFSPRATGATSTQGPGTFHHFDSVKRFVAAEHRPGSLLDRILGWFGMWQQVLPCAALAVLGGLTTRRLRRQHDQPSETEFRRASARNAAHVAVLGLGLTLLGFLLQWNYDPAGGGLWGTWTVPFSKWLFSPAYVLLAAGTGMLLYSAFFVWIDLLRWSSGRVLRVFGLNAIALYLAAELSFKVLWTRWQMHGPDGSSQSWMSGTQAWLTAWLGQAPGLWMHVVLYLCLWWLFCWWLDRKDWHLKV
ncbi:hypothetical protein Poly30_36970 [Planctomycetes bacterium Poly30]|uniref:Heparan-alpha-glucosaminide N-acetyltransferase catalytic domain-containing protein n=1 Tax=Saltatorellus ferox TaxID=2528018 RepID=A0A518EVP3_9BACT|nr:hypothetical protein Poly30_36970 [Planctomycetes bacterium Poly30]